MPCSQTRQLGLDKAEGVKFQWLIHMIGRNVYCFMNMQLSNINRMFLVGNLRFLFHLDQDLILIYLSNVWRNQIIYQIHLITRNQTSIYLLILRWIHSISIKALLLLLIPPQSMQQMLHSHYYSSNIQLCVKSTTI